MKRIGLIIIIFSVVCTNLCISQALKEIPLGEEYDVPWANKITNDNGYLVVTKSNSLFKFFKFSREGMLEWEESHAHSGVLVDNPIAMIERENSYEILIEEIIEGTEFFSVLEVENKKVLRKIPVLQGYSGKIKDMISHPDGFFFAIDSSGHTILKKAIRRSLRRFDLKNIAIYRGSHRKLIQINNENEMLWMIQGNQYDSVRVVRLGFEGGIVWSESISNEGKKLYVNSISEFTESFVVTGTTPAANGYNTTLWYLDKEKGTFIKKSLLKYEFGVDCISLMDYQITLEEDSLLRKKNILTISGENVRKEVHFKGSFPTDLYSKNHIVIFSQYDGEGKQAYLEIINLDKITSFEEEKNQNKKLIVFPNPASDFINVNIIQGNQISVLDTQGQKIMSGSNKTLNISKLKKGVYFIKEGTQITKFIKQ